MRRNLSRSPSGTALRLLGRWCATLRADYRIKDYALRLRRNFFPIDGRDTRVVTSEGVTALLAVSSPRGLGWDWRDLPAIRHGFCAPFLPARCTSGQSRAMLTAGWGHPRRRSCMRWVLGHRRLSRKAVWPLRIVTPGREGSRPGNKCIRRRSPQGPPFLLWILSRVPRFWLSPRFTAPRIPLSVIGPRCVIVFP